MHVSGNKGMEVVESGNGSGGGGGEGALHIDLDMNTTKLPPSTTHSKKIDLNFCLTYPLFHLSLTFNSTFYLT